MRASREVQIEELVKVSKIGQQAFYTDLGAMAHGCMHLEGLGLGVIKIYSKTKNWKTF